PYLSMLGMWALAFGCSVGQGAFVMPGGTFLPIAGPVGTAIGIVLGALVMIILAKNYHYLMNRYPDAGGTYTYTKRCFGYDHGFLSAWFLILTYIAILWANATALPIIARIFFGNAFRFGFSYEIAGFHIYFGEILLSVVAMAVAAFVCLKKKLAERVQIVMGVLLVIGVIACFIAAVVNHGAKDAPMFTPAFSDEEKPLAGVFTIFALAPWAYAGFESVSHSAGEAKFPLKRTFAILVVAIVTAALAYVLLVLLATTYAPDGLGSWKEYVSVLGEYGDKGVSAQPTFYAAFKALGNIGSIILGVAAFCGIFTGLIGNFIAVSRLAGNMAEDKMLPVWTGKKDKNDVPARVIFAVLIISLVIPFFGRTAISWIVDVTTVGATIAYMFTSAAAFKTAREEKSTQGMVFGVTGFIVSLFFAVAFLVPNLISVKTLATESYLIFAAWGLIGFLVFYWLLRHDDKRRLGRSNVALIVMLGLIIFTSTVWMSQSTDIAIKNSAGEINGYYTGVLEEVGVDEATAATKPTDQYLNQSLAKVDTAFGVSTMIQIGLIVLSIAALFVIYARIQKREKQVEVEKAVAEETSRAKTSFLSNMSHEIRTPMNAIIGLDNIALRDPDLSPKTREHLEKIGASAKHLLGLINDILDMSRIESGRMVLKDEEFSFRELVDQVNIIINGQCVEKGLDYECNIVGHLSDYYIGDDMKLKQVLINVLGNAVKFTPKGGAVTLTIEQADGGEEVKKMRFTMKDTGIGMDKDFIPKIFDSFSQEDATATNRYGGSGLGMAITKNFVEMMGGSIDVQSEKNVGSTFTVTVELKTSKRSYQAEQNLSLPDGFRAIVVDDDEIA
ncbi:MAG: amino acid permease, partial [Clostridia bacterium]|nr:amino acid permease [Clostridia bacterium]